VDRRFVRVTLQLKFSHGVYILSFTTERIFTEYPFFTMRPVRLLPCMRRANSSTINICSYRNSAACNNSLPCECHLNILIYILALSPFSHCSSCTRPRVYRSGCLVYLLLLSGCYKSMALLNKAPHLTLSRLPNINS